MNILVGLRGALAIDRAEEWMARAALTAILELDACRLSSMVLGSMIRRRQCTLYSIAASHYYLIGACAVEIASATFGVYPDYRVSVHATVFSTAVNKQTTLNDALRLSSLTIHTIVYTMAPATKTKKVSFLLLQILESGAQLTM